MAVKTFVMTSLSLSLRLITAHDNPSIAHIIREVSSEFGLGPTKGFAVGDQHLDDLYQFYQQEQAAYWVVVDAQDQVYGGGGISNLKGDARYSELQKMYLLPAARGQGLAKQLVQRALDFAVAHNKLGCYLETTPLLSQAHQLYQGLGFETLKAPLGQTGHSQACPIWMLKSFDSTTH